MDDSLAIYAYLKKIKERKDQLNKNAKDFYQAYAQSKSQKSKKETVTLKVSTKKRTGRRRQKLTT
jgi:predicted  nucleic acid-binding Zn-ribbon protein